MNSWKRKGSLATCTFMESPSHNVAFTQYPGQGKMQGTFYESQFG